MDRKNLTKLSTEPGVYLFKDRVGKVLYVGKAKNLKNRLRTYFSGLASKRVSRLVNPKVQVLLAKAEKVEWIGTGNEVEALLLESNLIKEHRPPFNVILRDDKNYLYIKAPLQDDFPRISLARQVVKDGAKYFGPFVDSKAVRDTVRLVHRIFPLCTGTSQKTGRACLNYHLGVCPGVCLGRADQKDYHRTIGEVIKFLGGDYAEVLKGLRRQMQSLSSAKQFERAAKLRDAILAVERISDKQQAISPDLKLNQDAIGLARELNKTVVALLQVRSGKLLNQQFFVMEAKYESGDEEVLAGFLRDYYKSAPELPKEILLHKNLTEVGIFEKWLSSFSGKKIDIIAPQRGRNRRLVRLAASNAKMRFDELAHKWDIEKKIAEEGLTCIKKLLKLKRLNRIEAYDISNLQGTDAVGSMVVFENGKMDKQQYRRFKIKSVSGPNDFASLAEVLQRRFKHKAGDTKFASLPDLLLIDGGKGQVSTVKKAIGDKIKIIGIAKGSHSASKAKAAPQTQRGYGDDLVFDGKVVILPNNSPAKMLLQRIRDEAHRFAIAYHTALRRKQIRASRLESIPGVGAVTRKKLLKTFGSMAGVKEASLGAIERVVGEKMAERIKNSL